MSVRVSPSSLFPCCSELLGNRHFRACIGEVNKCIATVVAGQGNIDVTAVIITLVACVNGNVMFDQLIRSKALQNTVWAEAQNGKRIAFRTVSSTYRPLLQSRAFAHQDPMSSHPKSHDYTLHLARSLFPLLKRGFDSPPPPHCVHAPTLCDIWIHPARDNARSWSLLLFLTACLSRTETVTAQVFRTIFLSAGLFHFEHNASSASAQGIQYNQTVRAEIANSKFSQVGKKAGQETSLLVSQHSHHVHVHHVYFLSTFSEIAQLEHVENRWAFNPFRKSST